MYCVPPDGPSQHVFLLPLMAHTRKPFPAPPVGFRPDGGPTGTYDRFTVRLWLNAAHLARSRRLPKFPNNRTGGPRTPRVSVPLRMTSCASSWTYAAVAGFCRIRYLSVFACVPRSEQCADGLFGVSSYRCSTQERRICALLRVRDAGRRRGKRSRLNLY